MTRHNGWITRWASFLTGICIGLLIVAPVLAFAQLPFDETTAATPRWVQSAQTLFDVVAMLLCVVSVRRLASPAQPKSRITHHRVFRA
jgi:hypothetical protein